MHREGAARSFGGTVPAGAGAGHRAGQVAGAPSVSDPPAEEHRLAQAVRELYGSGWAVYEGVRNTTGTPHDVLRYADVIAVDLWTGPDG